AHTIKGSSRAMGFTGVGELAHAMEDVLDGLRSDSISASAGVTEALFNGLDALKQMIDEIGERGETHLDPAQALSALKGIQAASSPGAQPSSISADSISQQLEALHHAEHFASISIAMEDARASGCEVLSVVIRLADDCEMKCVRAMMALRCLTGLGDILA